MELNELMKGCRTYRRFLQEPVGEEIIRECLENARTSSSAANRQPLYYYAVTSDENVKNMQPLVKWAASLPPEIGTRKLLSVPEEDQIRLVIALGKPSHNSTVVPVPEDGDLKYYVDDVRDYYVPKRAFEDVVSFV